MTTHRARPGIKTLAVLATAVLLMDPAPAAADTPLDAKKAVNYLNHEYIGDNWESYSNYMGDGIIQGVFVGIREESSGMCDLESSSINLSKPPYFQPQPGGGGLQIRIPIAEDQPIPRRPNYHYLHLTVECVHSVDAWMYFAVNGLITADSDAALTVDFLEIEINDMIASIFDVGGVARDKIIDAATGDLEENLAAFGRMRWNPDVSVANATREYYAGAPEDLPMESVVDILLVADGYTAATMPDYEAVIATIADEFLNPSDPERTQPYSNYSSAIRLWTIARPIPDSEVGNEFSPYRMLGAYKDKTSTKATFNNVAMVSLLPYDYDVTVVVGDAREMGAGSDVRANAVGRFVSLPTYGSAGNDADTVKVRRKTANTFMHELAHTPLGNLTDEYDRKTKIYRGPEPVPVNVSRNPNSPKWQNYPSATPQEGAYNYPVDVWRPYPTCRMRDSFRSAEGVRQYAFCPVCRAELTMNIYRHMSAFPFLVRHAQAQWPFDHGVSKESIANPTSNMQHIADLTVATGTEGFPTRTVLAVPGASLPEPWNVEWSITRAANPTTAPDVIVGKEVMVDLYPDDAIDLEISSTNNFNPDPEFTGFPTLFGNLTTIGRIAFPEGPPSRPESLSASPDENPIPNFYDPDTGVATSELRLLALPGCYANFTTRCTTEWKVSQETEDADLTFSTRPSSHRDDMAEVLSMGYFAEGSYTARARSTFTEFETPRYSDWVDLENGFTMGPLTLTTEPTKPHEPVLLRVSSCRDYAFLSATSWDVNGDKFRLEFEVRPSGSLFAGDEDPKALISTELIGGGPDDTDDPLSLRFEGQVRYDSTENESYDWQVRVVSESGGTGTWVRGPSFYIGAFSQCSTASAQERLAESLGEDTALLEKIIEGAWMHDPELANPHFVPCVGYKCEPFAIFASHLFDRLGEEPPVAEMRNLPAAISAALSGDTFDAKPPPTTFLKHEWKAGVKKSVGNGLDLFNASLGAGVPAILFAETEHLVSDAKTGLVNATVSVHAINIKENIITSVTALGTNIPAKMLMANTKTFSDAEQEAIANGAYLATLQLRAELTGATPPSKLFPAPPKKEGDDTDTPKGCFCQASDPTLSGGLLGLVFLGLLYRLRRRKGTEQ